MDDKLNIKLWQNSDKCIALISATGTLLESNDEFTEFCKNNKFLAIEHRSLVFKDDLQEISFKSFLSQAKERRLNISESLTINIPSGDSDPDYQATLIPVQITPRDCYFLLTVQPLSICLNEKTSYLLAQTNLTQSEIDVIYKLSTNLTVKEIAEVKNRSVHTIRTQIKNIQKKLKVKTQAAIISKIFQI